jgi:hypothetical protein
MKVALGQGTDNDAVRVQGKPSSPEYVLAGHWTGKEFAYAWIRPGVTEDDQPKLNLPVRTDWVASSAAEYEKELESKALKLNRIKGWLTLDLPGGGDQSSFPYHMALRKVGGSNSLRPGEVQTKEGEQYKVWLTASVADIEKAKQASGLQQRWVYVLSLDRDGTIRRIIPATEGNINNHVPPEGAQPHELQLTLGAPDFEIKPPYGLDTIILVTTADPIDPRFLPAGGVRTSSESRGAGDPLAILLGTIGTSGRSRGSPLIVPVTWSVETESFRSSAK